MHVGHIVDKEAVDGNLRNLIAEKCQDAEDEGPAGPYAEQVPRLRLTGIGIRIVVNFGKLYAQEQEGYHHHHGSHQAVG